MHFIAATAVLLEPSQLWQKMAPKRRNRRVRTLERDVALFDEPAKVLECARRERRVCGGRGARRDQLQLDGRLS